MSDLLDAAPPGTGELLGGRYRLIERVGSGGMGRVYRARDEILGRDVAVKLFHSDGIDPADEHRKISEAKLLASLNHPSLVTLFDAHVEQGDRSFLVMEFVDGPTLRHRILEGPIDVADAVAMTRDLASGLEAVHEAGIVHRDIKPSNVMMRPASGGGRTFHAVLADFGVAHLADATRHTSPGTVIGTAAYLAPEQVRGEQPMPASDVYALGLLLIEALTGRHPFGEGSMQETLLARLARAPEVPGTLGYRWKSLLTAMTAFDPTARPTAAEVVERAEHLGAAVEGGDITQATPSVLESTQPVPTTAPTTAVPASEPLSDGAGRHPSRVRWLVIALVVLALVIAAGVFMLVAALTSAPEPTVLPDLPAPLSEHMQQLLDGLTP
jgi:eukaryotic-like serine/threonine-protein kinase